MEELRAQFLSSLPTAVMIPLSNEFASLLFLSDNFVNEPRGRVQLALRCLGRRLFKSSSALRGWLDLFESTALPR